MSTFLSFVGTRPAAVAVAWRAWVDPPTPPRTPRAVPSRVILLHTERTHEDAVRLRDFIGVERTELHEFAPFSRPTGIVELARKLLPSGSDEVVFYAESGLTTPIAQLTRELPPERTTLLFSDVGMLRVRAAGRRGRTWRDQSSRDLGLTALLALAGVELEAGDGLAATARRAIEAAGCDLDSPEVRTDVRLSGSHVDAVRESRGRLLALVALARDAEPSDTRRVVGLGADRLTVRVSVLVSPGKAHRRLRERGVHVIDPGSANLESDLRAWWSGELPDPGRQTSHRAASLPATDARGAGGTGEPLLVCLGRDPSATLTSIHTHRPSLLTVFYDASSPPVVDQAERLLAVAPRLPVGGVRLLETDHLGRASRGHGKDLTETARDLAGRLEQNGRAPRIDVTPGTKAQAVALALADRGTLWSLAHSDGVARTVTGDTSIDLRPPDLLVQATVVGGELKRDGLDFTSPPWSDRVPDYQAVLEALALRVAESGSGDREVLFDGRRVRHRSRRLERVDGTASLSVPAGPKGGSWLEYVTAAALAGLGCDEVRCGLESDWQTGRWREEAFRDELDVAVRRGLDFLAFECKSGSTTRLGPAARALTTVTRHVLGRFAVPFLVVPHRGEREEAGGVTLVDLRDLADPVSLRSRLEAGSRRARRKS